MLSKAKLKHVHDLMMCFCERDEIAADLKISVEELEKAVAAAEGQESYDEVEKRWFAAGRAKVRQAQFSYALDGDRSMLLALGKEYLGQGDEKKPSKKKEENKGATVFGIIQGEFANAPDRKSKAAH